MVHNAYFNKQKTELLVSIASYSYIPKLLKGKSIVCKVANALKYKPKVDKYLNEI